MLLQNYFGQSCFLFNFTHVFRLLSASLATGGDKQFSKYNQQWTKVNGELVAD